MTSGCWECWFCFERINFHKEPCRPAGLEEIQRQFLAKATPQCYPKASGCTLPASYCSLGISNTISKDFSSIFFFFPLHDHHVSCPLFVCNAARIFTVKGNNHIRQDQQFHSNWAYSLRDCHFCDFSRNRGSPLPYPVNIFFSILCLESTRYFKTYSATQWNRNPLQQILCQAFAGTLYFPNAIPFLHPSTINQALCPIHECENSTMRRKMSPKTKFCVNNFPSAEKLH